MCWGLRMYKDVNFVTIKSERRRGDGLKFLYTDKIKFVFNQSRLFADANFGYYSNQREAKDYTVKHTRGLKWQSIKYPFTHEEGCSGGRGEQRQQT